jgi:hypothetical protein
MTEPTPVTVSPALLRGLVSRRTLMQGVGGVADEGGEGLGPRGVGQPEGRVLDVGKGMGRIHSLTAL